MAEQALAIYLIAVKIRYSNNCVSVHTEKLPLHKQTSDQDLVIGI